MKVTYITPTPEQMIENRRKAMLDIKSQIEDAHIKGRAEGETRFARLVNLLLASGRIDDINRCSSDEQYRHQLYSEFHIE